MGKARSLRKSGYSAPVQKDGVEEAWARSRPLEKNLGREEVVMRIPGGWVAWRVSRAVVRAVQEVVVRRLSGGAEIVRR